MRSTSWRAPPSPACAPPRDRSASGLRLKHRRAAQLALTETLQRLVGLLQREDFYGWLEGDRRRNLHELVTIGAREVRHRAHRALAPENPIGKTRDVAHVYAGAHDSTSFAGRRERCGHQRTDRSKQD